MADNTLFKRLSRLFSTNVVIRNVGGQLKVADTERMQSFSDLATNFMKSRGLAYFHSTAARYGYDLMANIATQRITIFRDYELMETDPIIASALDIYADECTVKDEFGEILTIRSDNEKVKNILYNLFYDILNVEFNMWPWIRNMCKYGDMFLKLEISEKFGIVNVIPISPYEIQREEGFDMENPFKVRFNMQGISGGKDALNQYEVAHFRLLSDTNFLPYGKAMIEPARRVWKQLQLMEDAMLIHRIMRAPEKRIFKIDTANIPPSDVEMYMKNMVNKIKKVPYVDPSTGDYNLKFNMMNMTEDFFIPVRGGDSGTSIDTLPGLEYNAMEDVEYLRNKMMAALKVPKAFLGYEEGLSGKATLAAEDVRFARTIERVQRIFVSELYKIAIVHLVVQGLKDEEIVDFTLELTNPSTILEQEKISLWQEKVSLIRDMKETKMFGESWIYKNVVNLTEEDIKQQKLEVIGDAKRAFRIAQIEGEGNDPFVTKQTFGTPHDLAMLQQKSKEIAGEFSDKKIDFGDNNFKLDYSAHEDDKDSPSVVGGYHKDERGNRAEKERDPEDDYGEQNHVRGKDPLGGAEYAGSHKRDTERKPRFRSGSPLSLDSVDNLKNKYGIKDLRDALQKKAGKSQELISESLKSDEEMKKDEDSRAEHSDDGTMLDEENLLDI